MKVKRDNKGRFNGYCSKHKHQHCKKIIEKYLAGESYNEIAKEFKLTRKIIYGVLKRHNVKLRGRVPFFRHRKLTREIVNSIIQRYNNSIALSRIAEEFEIDKSTVFDVLKRQGVRLRGHKGQKAWNKGLKTGNVPKNKITDSVIIEKIIMLYAKNDYSVERISQVLNISRNAILRILKERGINPKQHMETRFTKGFIPSNKITFDKSRINKILNLYEKKNYSPQMIINSLNLNCSMDVIYRILRENGVKRHHGNRGYTDKVIHKIRLARLKQQFPNPSKQELMLKKELESRGIKFEHNKKIYEYQPDFIFPDHKLVVECDGDYWHANPKKYPDINKLNKTQKRHVESDRKKDAKLMRKGWFVLRFWCSDIKKDVSACVDKIEEELERN